MQIFPEIPKQLIEGGFAQERSFVQFWELEQGVLVSHDLNRAQTVDEDSDAEVVKKEKLLHPPVCKHFSWQPVTVPMVVVELSKLS